MSKFGEITMKREIRPGEYEGILKKLKDAAPPEDLYNEVLKAHNNFKITVQAEQEEWKEVTEILKIGVYPEGEQGIHKKVNYDFLSQLSYKNEGEISIRFPELLFLSVFSRYFVRYRGHLSFDRDSVVEKEQYRKYWIAELEKSNAIGLTTPLTGEQYTSISDCCKPISIEYLKGLVKEAEGMPCLSPEMVLEYVKDCFVKVYNTPNLSTPPEKGREGRCFWFGKFF